MKSDSNELTDSVYISETFGKTSLRVIPGGTVTVTNWDALQPSRDPERDKVIEDGWMDG